MTQITKFLEECIERLVEDFQRLAINFVVEADLEAELFKLLRRGPSCRKNTTIDNKRREIYLVHTQWPLVKSNKSGRLQKSGCYDLVIWQRSSVPRPDKYWGVGALKRAEKMKLHVVVEMKHRRNSLKPADEWSERDIDKLGKALDTGAKYAYYLVFIDQDINTAKRKTRYQDITEYLARRARKYAPRLKVLCVARSGVRNPWVN